MFTLVPVPVFSSLGFVHKSKLYELDLAAQVTWSVRLLKVPLVQSLYVTIVASLKRQVKSRPVYCADCFCLLIVDILLNSFPNCVLEEMSSLTVLCFSSQQKWYYHGLHRSYRRGVWRGCTMTRRSSNWQTNDHPYRAKLKIKHILFRASSDCWLVKYLTRPPSVPYINKCFKWP